MVKISTTLVLGIHEYLKTPGSKVSEQKHTQGPWSVASCICKLTCGEDALGSSLVIKAWKLLALRDKHLCTQQMGLMQCEMKLGFLSAKLRGMWHLKHTRVGEIFLWSSSPSPALPWQSLVYLELGVLKAPEIPRQGFHAAVILGEYVLASQPNRKQYKFRIFLFRWKLRTMQIFVPTVLCCMPLKP